MPIEFDKNGNVEPYEAISASLRELNETFVAGFEKSVTRPTLFEGYGRYIDALEATLSDDFQQWVGGSFISAKLNPNDIDVVNLVAFDEKMDAKLATLMPFLLIGGSLETFGVDGHLLAIYPPSDERFTTITEPVRSYWQNWLSHDRDNNPRGFLELTFKTE